MNIRGRLREGGKDRKSGVSLDHRKAELLIMKAGAEPYDRGQVTVYWRGEKETGSEDGGGRTGKEFVMLGPISERE